MDAGVERKHVDRTTLTPYFCKLKLGLFFPMPLGTVEMFGNCFQNCGKCSVVIVFSQCNAQMKEDIVAMNSEAENHRSATARLLNDLAVLHGNVLMRIPKQNWGFLKKSIFQSLYLFLAQCSTTF